MYLIEANEEETYIYSFPVVFLPCPSDYDISARRFKRIHNVVGFKYINIGQLEY